MANIHSPTKRQNLHLMLPAPPSQCRQSLFLSPLLESKGMALLPLIIAFTILGLLIGFGLKRVGPQTTMTKQLDTRALMHAAQASISSWSAAQGLLPSAALFPAVVKNDRDIWTKPLVYLYDAALTTQAGGGICGRRTTALTLGGSTDIAYVLISGGNDFNINSSPAVSGATTGNISASPQDILFSVSLSQLKRSVNCFAASAKGRLHIINNELAKACSLTAYTADIFAEGGLAPFTWTYTTSPSPSWLAAPAGPLSGNHLVLQGTPPTAADDLSITLTLSDGDGSLIQRTFEVDVIDCGP